MNAIVSCRAAPFLCALALGVQTLAAEEPAAAGALSVAECLRRVAERSPELKSGSYKIEAAARRATQAAKPLNPRLSTEVENVAGSGAVSGVDAAETTVSLSQEFELGGKRRSRADAAEAEAAASRAGQEVLLSEQLAEARQAALLVQTAQEECRYAEQALALAQETAAAAEARERAGKGAALETERARAECVQASLELEARRTAQRDALRALALLWGETEPSFERISDPLDAEPAGLVPLEDLLVRAAQAPALRADAAQLRAAEARIGVERAGRTPNLELSAGVRRLEERDDVGFVVGASVELPLHTRGWDGVRAAEADAEAARLDAAAARLKREGLVRQLYARLAALTAKRARLKTDVAPAAERALGLVREAHRQGKTGYLDLLEARRALLATQRQLIDSAAECQALRNELERLAPAPSATH
jgi:cobalt-zinc-cadmium efflux system outer membrane protein